MNLISANSKMVKDNKIQVVLITKCRLLGFAIEYLLRKDKEIVSFSTYYEDTFFDHIFSNNGGINGIIIDADYLNPVQIKVITRLAEENLIPQLIIISSSKKMAHYTQLSSGKVCHINKNLKAFELFNLLEMALNIRLPRGTYEATSGAKLITNLPSVSPPENELTPCEKSVIKMILKGLSVSDVSKFRGRSIKTISAQKNSALKKLGMEKNYFYISLTSYVKNIIIQQR